jgi:penicillin-binding protein 1C
VLPRDPARAHPGRGRERLRERRDALLARLHAYGDLDDLELALALREPLPQRAHELPREAPHLFDTLLARSGGVAAPIETTLDPRLQRRVRELAAEHARTLERQGIHNLAALVVDNASFEVRAYVGNSEPRSSVARGHAVDIVQRPRSTGSILKPLLFAALLENGELLPDTLVPDVPTQFGSYRPENFDQRFRGAVPASEALARSLNVPAVHLLSRHGVDRFQGLLQRLGMKLPRPAGDYGLTLVLGGAEGTLWEIATLYANLAHLAGARPPRAALHYRTLQVRRDTGERRGARAEIGPGAAWLTLQALEAGERSDEASPWRRFQSELPIAWKTGTSYGLRDAWAVGVTAEATIAVWAGNASGEGVPGLTGIDAAAPLLFALFAELGAAHAPAPPVEDLRPVSVCADDGYLATPFCAARTAWVPRHSRFAQPSPFHRRVYVDAGEAWQVHAGCEALDRMSPRSWFVLPPAQEAYYRQVHAEYRSLPPLRADCRDAAAASADLEILYPPPGARFYIPVDLAGARSRAVLEAVHRRADAVVYWHLDGAFLGQTRHFHRWPLDAAPGPHRLTLIDDRGRTLERRFEILGTGDDAAAASE